MDGCFYEKGLDFQCTRCSSCCRGEPGYVFLQEADIERLGRRSGLDRQAFLKRYCRVIDMGIERLYSLREKKNNDCIFWMDGCSVYEDRPIQCSTYPFWIKVVGSEASWKEESASCPGIGEGRTYSKQEIEERLYARRRSKPIGPDDQVSL